MRKSSKVTIVISEQIQFINYIDQMISLKQIVKYDLIFNYISLLMIVVSLK
jgi:hypothetical protein